MAVALVVHEPVQEALKARRHVVALESTLLAHGLPWPVNLETARAAEQAVRDEGGTPATIAILDGQLKIGLTEVELEHVARGKGIAKASRRDLATMVAQRGSAATTVAATMFLAHRGGIHVLATGGIGGVHRDAAESFDVSADAYELARTPVAVVCGGAKNILDIPRTLELLETLGVPVVGFGVEEFPAFYHRSSGIRLDTHLEKPEEVAQLLRCHWELGGAGIVIAQPPPAELALAPAEFEAALHLAEREAYTQQICGKALTPFLLRRLAEITEGKTLKVNQALAVANARLATRIADRLSGV